MLRKIIISSVALMALFAVAGSALFFATPSFAQVEDAVGEVVERQGRRNGKRGILTHDEKAAVVANTLGISVDELEAAKEDGSSVSDLAAANGVSTDAIADAIYAASVTKVNQMVADGDLTQEEADALLDRLALKQLAKSVIDRSVITERIASAVGVSVEEWQAARENDGERSELIEAAGLTRDDIVEIKTTAINEMIDQAEANGEITAEEADQLREMPVKKGGRHGGNQPVDAETTDA